MSPGSEPASGEPANSEPASGEPFNSEPAVVHIDRVVPDADADGWSWPFRLVGPTDADLARADAAVVGGITWDADRFDSAPRLRVLARTGIGVDAVDLAEATSRGVMVTNTPDGPTVSTAEHAMALLLAVAKTLPAHQGRLRRAAGGYAQASTAVELDGLTLGLVGYGRIARRVARSAKALGMKVLAHDPYLPPDLNGDDAVGVGLVGFDDLLSAADVLSLHAPLTVETSGLFNQSVFDRCRPGVILINAARGALVVTDDLVAAIADGRVAAAGLDVTEPEPLPADHPLLGFDQVIVTPHVASATVVGRRRMLTMALDQVEMALSGQRPTHLVNTEVLDRSPVGNEEEQ